MTARSGLEPYTPAVRRRVLRDARGLGSIPWDRLDRLLVEACVTALKLKGLLRSLKGVQVVATEGPGDPFQYSLDGPAPPNGSSNQDLLESYIDRVRRLPRLTRTQEHVLARRLEFTRERLHEVVRGMQITEETRERILSRGTQCSSILEGSNCASEADAATPPCGSVATPVQCACLDYNRARARFVERNLYLVVGMAGAYRTYGVPLMDLIQEGNASLIRAVEKFDWRKDVRFQTYGAFWVRQAIERLITANRGIVRVPNYIQQKMRRLRREGKLPRNHKDMDIRSVSELFGMNARMATRLMETDRSWYSLDTVMGEEDSDPAFVSTLASTVPEPRLSSSERHLLGKRLIGVMRKHLTDQERAIIMLRFGLDGGEPRTLDQIGERMSVSRERIRQIQVKALDKLKRPMPLKALEDFL